MSSINQQRREQGLPQHNKQESFNQQRTTNLDLTLRLDSTCSKKSVENNLIETMVDSSNEEYTVEGMKVDKDVVVIMKDREAVKREQEVVNTHKEVEEVDSTKAMVTTLMKSELNKLISTLFFSKLVLFKMERRKK